MPMRRSITSLPTLLLKPAACGTPADPGQTPNIPSTGTAVSSVETGVSRNLFAECLAGSEGEARGDLESARRHLFHGDVNSRCAYYPAGEGLGCAIDIGNEDVSSEGMPHWVVITVRLDTKTRVSVSTLQPEWPYHEGGGGMRGCPLSIPSGPSRGENRLSDRPRSWIHCGRAARKRAAHSQHALSLRR
jgi:hypothetical protein